jgi:RNA polymerase sigma-70 factor (ECF subfamily)
LPAISLQNEKELLLLTSRGDEKAFTELFHAYRNKVYTVAYKLTVCEENAEEIVQDVFLKVWLKRIALAEVESLDSWLFIITRNTVYTFLKSKAHKALHHSLAETELIGCAEGADARLKEKEFHSILKEAVEKLPQQQKQVYRLSKEVGLKQDEIAIQLNIAPETARKHLQFAMRSIRAYLLSRMELGILLIILWEMS